VISLFNDHPDRADPCKLQRHPLPEPRGSA
jgi:hypothetical protein